MIASIPGGTAALPSAYAQETRIRKAQDESHESLKNAGLPDGYVMGSAAVGQQVSIPLPEGRTGGVVLSISDRSALVRIMVQNAQNATQSFPLDADGRIVSGFVGHSIAEGKRASNAREGGLDVIA